MREIVVNNAEQGMILEKYIRKVFPNIPLSLIYKTFRKKDFKVNGKREGPKYVLNSGDVISVYISDDLLETKVNKSSNASHYDLKNLITYEDDNLLIINKPRGLLVQKDSASSEALDDIVKEYYTNNSNRYIPGPLHRLDRNTCGLVMFAKNYIASEYFSKVIREKTQIEKHYLTLVKGNVTNDGEVNAPIKKNEHNAIAHINVDEGKDALTRYHVIKHNENYSLLDVVILTGRTHQIRLHLSYIGFPVIGDNKYGDFSLNHLIEKEYGFKNQFLCAYKLIFRNLDRPFNYLNNKKVEINLPSELSNLINKLF